MGPKSRRFAMIHIGLFVAALPLLPTRARAACSESINFGQFTSACSGGTADCYVLSPGFNTPESIASSFWSLHGGNASVGLGTDNGSWEAPEAWLHASLLGNWLNGSWSDAPGIDGCIGGQFPPGKPSEIMVTGFSDTDVFGTHGYFAAASVRRYAAQWPQFDFAGSVGRNIELKPIPRPEFYPFTRIGTGAWRAQVRSPNAGDLAGGFYTDGSTGFNEAVVGYRIYKLEPSNGWPPSDRRRSAWTPVTGVVPFGQMASFDYLCLGQFVTY